MVVILLLVVVVVLFLFWRFWFFFRNPKRVIPLNEDHILSPADGVIIYMRRVVNNGKQPILTIKKRNAIWLTDLMHVKDDALQGTSGYLIGIFMTPFDVHYNRAPIAGHISKIAHSFPAPPLSRRKNQCMFNALSNLVLNEQPYHHDSDYLIDNERASYVLKNPRVTLYVTQIAERWIRRIVTFKQDENIAQGEIFGLIRMGSQVDLFVPDSYGFVPKVVERQRVKAGLSVLLERRPIGRISDA